MGFFCGIMYRHTQDWKRGFTAMQIRITTEYITLGQLLKITDWISSGGEAKFAVKDLSIKVNGVAEDRRGRKLRVNDVVQVENKAYELIG